MDKANGVVRAGRYGRGVAEVLIIEDDDRIRPLLVRGLRECGHTVSSAPTGMGGLQLAVDSGPDLVVLDLGLPDVDGTQVLTMLRAVSAVPVIIASARADDPSLVGALDAGADDYVVKPFTSAQLDARVRAVLRRTESGRGRQSPPKGAHRGRSRGARVDTAPRYRGDGQEVATSPGLPTPIVIRGFCAGSSQVSTERISSRPIATHPHVGLPSVTCRKIPDTLPGIRCGFTAMLTA